MKEYLVETDYKESAPKFDDDTGFESQSEVDASDISDSEFNDTSDYKGKRMSKQMEESIALNKLNPKAFMNEMIGKYG